MPLNKDIIIRFIIGTILGIISFYVLIPTLYKIWRGNQNSGPSLDELIERKKAQLLSGGGLQSHHSANNPNMSDAQVFFINLQKNLQKKYHFQLANQKFEKLIKIIDRDKIWSLIGISFNQKNAFEIDNFLENIILFWQIVDEIRHQKSFINERLAKLFHRSLDEIKISWQLLYYYEIEKNTHSQFWIKNGKKLHFEIVLHELTDELFIENLVIIMKKKISSWSKNPDQIIEDLGLYLTYLDYLPTPGINYLKIDLKNAYQILQVAADANKKACQKAFHEWSQTLHPDKIQSIELPKIIHELAIQKYASIKTAYELMIKNENN